MPTKRTANGNKVAAKPKYVAGMGKVAPLKGKKNSGKKNLDICFVIMPFGGWLDDYYEAIHRPAIESAC